MEKSFIVHKNNNIKHALEVINKNGNGAVAVVDDNNQLVRVLTDGDIRRALLDGVDIDINSAIDNTFEEKKSFFIKEYTNYKDALVIMDTNEIDHIIVVNDSNQVVDLYNRKDLAPILLSVPHMGEDELKYVGEAFRSNWIAPLGPNVDGFEKEIAEVTGAKYAAALSSGTAAIHLSLVLLGVQPDDIVLCSSLTFAASANPILYQYATPIFVDSEPDSWNMSPIALEAALEYCSQLGKKPKAIIVVNLYGQSADMDALSALSERYQVPIVEDAAESLGATYKGKQSGTFGKFGIYSFNGNKIITTSGGGMLVSDNEELIEKARFLATQSRDPAPYYEHSQIGYNYRMSNVLAGIGRGQLKVLSERVESRREVYKKYVKALTEIKCLDWMPELEGYYSNRWLTAVVINPLKTTRTVTEFIEYLKDRNIEARHVWKPMHLQPIFKEYKYFKHNKSDVSLYLFENGVCLPSASSMCARDQNRIIQVIKEFFNNSESVNIT
jgi:dTDP-4-amino-4,6-dideoxygalactose transaminase